MESFRELGAGWRWKQRGEVGLCHFRLREDARHVQIRGENGPVEVADICFFILLQRVLLAET